MFKTDNWSPNFKFNFPISKLDSFIIDTGTIIPCEFKRRKLALNKCYLT